MKGSAPLDLRSILRLCKRWAWLVILACVLGGVAGLVVNLLQPKLYQATTTIYLVSPNHSDYNSVSGVEEVAKAFALIPQSHPVLVAALKATGDHELTPTQLSTMLTVLNDRGTQFIDVQIRDTDPERASRLSIALAQQSILDYSATINDTDQSQQFLKNEITALQPEITNLEQQLSSLQKQAAQPSAPPNLSDQINQVNTSLGEKRTLYNELFSTYTNMDTTKAVILQAAQVPTKPLGAGWPLAAALGALAGLVAISAIILLLEQLGSVLHTPSASPRLTTSVSVKPLAEMKKLSLMQLEENETAPNSSANGDATSA